MHILHLNQRNQRDQILFQYLRDKKKKKEGGQKKGGENSPISPPLDPRLPLCLLKEVKPLPCRKMIKLPTVDNLFPPATTFSLKLVVE